MAAKPPRDGEVCLGFFWRFLLLGCFRRLKTERDTVHAIAQAARARTVRKDMAEMTMSRIVASVAGIRA